MSSIPYSSTSQGSSINTVVVVDVVVEDVVVEVVESSTTLASSISPEEQATKTSVKKVINNFLIAIKNTDIVRINN